MTEENQTQETQPPFTLQELDDYFHAHCNNSACPFCGGEDWYLAEPSNGKVFSSLATKTDGALPLGSEALPLVTLICHHCHFVRQHAYKPVHEWVEGERNPKARPELKKVR